MEWRATALNALNQVLLWGRETWSRRGDSILIAGICAACCAVALTIVVFRIRRATHAQWEGYVTRKWKRCVGRDVEYILDVDDGYGEESQEVSVHIWGHTTKGDYVRKERHADDVAIIKPDDRRWDELQDYL